MGRQKYFKSIFIVLFLVGVGFIYGQSKLKSDKTKCPDYIAKMASINNLSNESFIVTKRNFLINDVEYEDIIQDVKPVRSSLNCFSKKYMSQTVNIPAKEYFFISVKELEDVIKQKDFILINTHTPFDGDIPFTDTSIIFDKIEENLDLLPRDKNIKLVIYCRSGHMSAIASQKLADLGYTNVYDLIGGMKAWVNAGNKLIKG